MLLKADMEASATKQSLEVDYQVVHRNERRIRVCIPRLSSDSEYVQSLKQVIESLDFVTDVRINLAANSLAIEYETKGIKSSLIQEKILSIIQQAGLSETLMNLETDVHGSSFMVYGNQQDGSDSFPPSVKYKVVHRNERRIRLCIPQLAEDEAYADQLKHLVESIDGVANVRINPPASSIAVEYDGFISEVAITTAQQKLFEAIQQATSTQSDRLPKTAQPQKSGYEINYWERLGLPAVSLGVALLAGPLELSLPFLVVCGLIGGAAMPIFSRAIAGIAEERKYKVDILDSLWIALHTLQGQYVAPALMVSLVEASEAMRDISARTNKLQTLKLLDSEDHYALVERDGKEQQLPLQQVNRGDKVIVYPGDLVPVDGRILYGTALIDEHIVTGKTEPTTYLQGQRVYAATLVIRGKVCILAEQTGKATHAARVAHFLSASVADTQAGDAVKEVSDRLVVPTLLLSSGIFALTGNVSPALAPLQLDFGTGIGIAVPTTILAALTHAARSGVFIRNGRVLEVLARIDTVVFGKTGTLTQAIATVVDIQTADAGIPTAQVLALAASAQQQLDHPLARAIVHHAEKNGVQLLTCEAWDYQVGMGVTTRIDGHKILVGSDRFLQQAGVVPIYMSPDWQTDSHTLVYVARDGQLLGVILLDNPIRLESASVVATLTAQGIETHLLTGDTQQAANAVATQLGIEIRHTYGSSLPEQKIEIVRKLHNQGKTVMYIGGELSDTEALAYADVSVSFAQGTDIEEETADVILLGDLRGLIQAIDIAKQAMELVHQNIAIIAVPNVSVVIAGVFFGLHPVAAVLINNCTALIAEINGWRPQMDKSLDN